MGIIMRFLSTRFRKRFLANVTHQWFGFVNNRMVLILQSYTVKSLGAGRDHTSEPVLWLAMVYTMCFNIKSSMFLHFMFRLRKFY